MGMSTHRLVGSLVLTATLGTVTLMARDAPRPGVDWPSFRGPRASGVADGFPTPVSWNVEESKGVLWKIPVPGLGNSSPVVWENRVCLTTAVGGKDSSAKAERRADGRPASITDEQPLEWRVMCFAKGSGKVDWVQTSHKGVPATGRHGISTHANPTLATDGTHLVAFFGSEGLYCYRLSDGRLLWKKSFGLLDSGWFKLPSWQWGFSSSPVIHDSKVIVQCDVQKDSFIAALSVKDGKELWRTPRNDVPTFGTPTVFEENGRAQVVVNGWREMAGYDLATGKRLWSINAGKVGGDIPIPTPIVGRGLIFITNSHLGTPIFAIRTDARGDVSLEDEAQASTHIAWSKPREGTYMPTSILYGDHLYVNRDIGVLSVYDAATGTRLYQQRLGSGGGFIASAVAGDGKVYFTSTDGEVFVVKAGPLFEMLSVNSMGEVCQSSPAISEGRLYFRTLGHLVAIGDAKHSKGVRKTSLGSIAAEPDLRRYFTEKGVSSDRVAEEIRRFSQRVLGASVEALPHAKLLKWSASTISSNELSTLSAERRRQKFDSIRENASAVEREIKALRQELQLVFGAGSPPEGAGNDLEVTDAVSLQRACERLYELSLAINRVIRSSFVRSTETEPPAVKAAQFWQSLVSAEKLAAAIQRAELKW